MDFSPLSQLRQGTIIWRVRVYVSRLWQHRGGTDHGPIKHSDMVLLDAQGNHMYAEVPEKNVDSFIDRIEEGKIYDIRKFLVFPRKYVFRPVEGHSMIKFTKRTELVERTGMEAEFPFCTYALTPIAQLPRPTDMPERFTDIIGLVTGVSEAVQYVSASRPEPSTKRVIHLKDLTGHQITVILWGDAALAFDADEVMELGNAEPVIVIFVGTLVKTYDGHRGVSGSAACRWYINEDLPDIRDFRNRLRDNFAAIEHINLPGQTAAEVDAQMACVALSDLRSGWDKQAVCVRVARLWHYCGGLENGPVKLVHMVLIDAHGNHGYAVVPTDFLAAHVDMLHEGVVYEFNRFAVLPRPIILNPIDAPLMIKFTQFTVVKNRFHLNDEFPEWTFNLTPMNELPPANDTPQAYTDVIGVITAISPVKSVRVPNTLRQVFMRRVLLSDNNGHELGITLWGERAIRFNGESVHFMGQIDPAVAVFVGTTVCIYEGSKELSGGCACKWYINHDIPDINVLRSRLPASFPAIEHLPTPSKIILQVQHADVHPMVLLTHLMNINLYQKQAGTFRCNVLITRVSHLKKWWATFCTDCNYMSMPTGTSLTQPDVYTCGRRSCSCTRATIRYTLFVLAKDRSGEAEFELFGAKAQQIVGQSAEQVLRNSLRHGPVIPNVHVAASMLRKTPPELTALLSMRCKFVVRASPESFFGRWPAFHVDAIESFEPVRTNLSVMDLLTPS